MYCSLHLHLRRECAAGKGFLYVYCHIWECADCCGSVKAQLRMYVQWKIKYSALHVDLLSCVFVSIHSRWHSYLLTEFGQPCIQSSREVHGFRDFMQMKISNHGSLVARLTESSISNWLLSCANPGTQNSQCFIFHCWTLNTTRSWFVLLTKRS